MPALLLLRLPVRTLIVLAGLLGVAGFLLGWPAADPLLRVTSVMVLSIALWATGWLAQWLTALVFFTLCTVAGVASADTVFAGFSSAATWLVFSGLVIGAAIHYTGLGSNLASRAGPLLSPSYRLAVGGVVALGLAMAFVMPSGMGRIVLLTPILITLADHLGYTEGRRGRTGVILGGMMGTFLPTYAILPANVPNNVLMGAAETVLGAPPSYSAYLLLHFPVLGLLKAVILVWVMLRLFPDGDPRPEARQAADSPALSGAQKGLAWLLVAAVLLWLSDAWHGVSPAWIGMAIALVCLFPGSGLMKAQPLQSLNVESLIYVAGIVSLGALAHESGLGAYLAHSLLVALPLGEAGDAATFGLLGGLAMALGSLITLPGVPAVLTPLAPEMATITGWSPEAIAMSQVVGFSTVLLPYQAPPLVVGLISARLPLRDAMRILLVMATVSLIVLWPLDYLWWQLLGWI